MSFVSTELTNYLKQCNLTEQQQENILDLIDEKQFMLLNNLKNLMVVDLFEIISKEYLEILKSLLFINQNYLRLKI